MFIKVQIKKTGEKKKKKGTGCGVSAGSEPGEELFTVLQLGSVPITSPQLKLSALQRSVWRIITAEQ